jgi:hypothetical protein
VDDKPQTYFKDIEAIEVELMKRKVGHVSQLDVVSRPKWFKKRYLSFKFLCNIFWCLSVIVLILLMVLIYLLIYQ